MLTPKPDKDNTKNENYRSISLMNLEIFLVKYLQSEFNNSSKKSYNMTKFHSRNAKVFQHLQISKYNRAHQQNQRQKSHDHLNRCRKGLWQNSTSCCDKTLMKLGIEGIFPNIINTVYDKHIPIITLKGEKWYHFL
jgi:hypothetical protein